MERQQAIATIRSSWREILAAWTGPAKARANGETSYICPICQHGTNGDGITNNPQSKDGNSLHCFGCSFSGDIIELQMKTTGQTFNDAINDLAQRIGLVLDRPSPKKGPQNDFYRENTGKPTQDPTKNVLRGTKAGENEAQADYTAYYKECSQRITDPAAASYLQGRGISLDTATRYHVGYDPAADPANVPGAAPGAYKPHPTPRIIVPCSTQYYIARAIDPNVDSRFKAPAPKGSGGKWAAFNYEALFAQDVQEVFICEGIFDALSILEVGAAAISINSADNAYNFIRSLSKGRIKATLILCLDNDEAGARAAETIKNGLQRLNIRFITADICQGHKDPNEALIADRDRFHNGIMQAAEAAREYKAHQIEEARQEELERQQRTGAGMVDAFLNAVRTKRYEPTPTGISDIDRAIGGGFIRQQLILLGAAPGAGKTSLAQWIFEGMAKNGQSCLYLNLEMSRDQMLARSLSRIAAQDGDKIKATDILQGYKWDWTQEATVLNAAEKYKEEIAPRMIYNPEEVTADLDNILSYLEKEAARTEAADLPVPCVVLDYLQIIRGREREDDTATIKRAMWALKKFAIEHNTFIFVITANNRNANKSGDVTMESGRDSSALEYGADIQLGLAYTKCLKRPGQEPKTKDELTPEELKYVTLKITKGRWGGPGTDVDLYFDGETMSYYQTIPAEQQPARNYTRI